MSLYNITAGIKVESVDANGGTTSLPDTIHSKSGLSDHGLRQVEHLIGDVTKKIIDLGDGPVKRHGANSSGGHYEVTWIYSCVETNDDGSSGRPSADFTHVMHRLGDDGLTEVTKIGQFIEQRFSKIG